MNKLTEGITVIEGKAFQAALTRRESGVISLKGALHAGPWHADSGKEPIADVAASLLDEGTGLHPRSEFRNLLEALGARVSFWADDRYVYFSLLSTAVVFPEALSLLMEALEKPALLGTAIAEVLEREAAERIHDSENTSGEAYRAFTRNIFQKDTPGFLLSSVDERNILLSLKGEELLPFIQNNYRGRIVFSVVGDIQPAVLETLLKKVTETWNEKPGASGRLPSALPVPDVPRESSVSIPGKESVDVYMGAHLPMNASNPSYVPVSIAVDLLGGGFADHLTQTIRDRDGLTYSTYARIKGKENGVGLMWHMWAMFGNSLYEKGVAAMKRELGVFFKEGITEKTLTEKKEELLGRYAVYFSSHERTGIEILSGMLVSGDPKNIDRYLEQVQALSVKGVRDAAEKYLRIDAVAAAGAIDEKGKLL